MICNIAFVDSDLLLGVFLMVLKLYHMERFVASCYLYLLSRIYCNLTTDVSQMKNIQYKKNHSSDRSRSIQKHGNVDIYLNLFKELGIGDSVAVDVPPLSGNNRFLWERKIKGGEQNDMPPKS